jgi:hypothetical protein
MWVSQQACLVMPCEAEVYGSGLFFSNGQCPSVGYGVWGLVLATSLATSHCTGRVFGYGGRRGQPLITGVGWRHEPLRTIYTIYMRYHTSKFVCRQPALLSGSTAAVSALLQQHLKLHIRLAPVIGSAIRNGYGIWLPDLHVERW